jgi:hypothetical protein
MLSLTLTLCSIKNVTEELLNNSGSAWFSVSSLKLITVLQESECKSYSLYEQKPKKINSHIYCSPHFVTLFQGKFTEQGIPKLLGHRQKQLGKTKASIVAATWSKPSWGKRKLLPLLGYGDKTHYWVQIFLCRYASNYTDVNIFSPEDETLNTYSRITGSLHSSNSVLSIKSYESLV